MPAPGRTAGLDAFPPPGPGEPIVLAADNHCLFVLKPAGRLVAGDATGDATLLGDAKAYLKRAFEKPGEVYLGLVHRLDRPVSGVVLFARTGKAAGRLSTQFRERRARKTYFAVVAGPGPHGELRCRDFMIKDRTKNRSRVVPDDTAGAAEAVLTCRTLSRENGRALLEVKPATGRPHQIRVQLAARGWPIVGDVKYGGPPLPEADSGRSIALHAAALEVEHPTKKTPVRVAASPPEAWTRYGLPTP